MISGEIFGVSCPVTSITGLTLLNISVSGRLDIPVGDHQEVLFYVVDGDVTVNGARAATHDLVIFEKGEGTLEIEAHQPARIITGLGTPHDEPIVAYGPFVMNTEAEIQQAYADFQSGKMGTWVE